MIRETPPTKIDHNSPLYKKTLRKRMILMLIIIGSLLAAIFLIDIVKNIFISKMIAKFIPTTVTISTSVAESEVWTPTINAIGSLVAINGVQVSPELSGMVIDIKFQSGEMVKAGQPLIQLDARTDQQDLNNLEAQLQLAQIKYNQQVALFQTKSTSQTSLDESRAQLQEAQASVQKTQVLIDQKTIKAPFSGKIGIRTINLGQYVSPGNELASLQSLNPLHAQFTLPEQHLKNLHVDQPIEFQVSNYPNEIFKGKISALDATVNPQTRNILVEATVPNDHLRLYPGMFAKISVLLPTKEKVISVPQTAVSFSLYGSAIFVVTEEGKDENGKPILKAYQRYITTGNMQNNKVAVTKGLKAGEIVVTSGQLKLVNGTPVTVNNKISLPNMTPSNLEKNRT